MAKAAKKQAKAEAPAPGTFTQETADAICDRIAAGESLRTICADEAMPACSTVFKWLADPEYKPFAEQYARAREEQAETLAAEIVAIADEECTMVRSSKHPNAKADDDDNLEVVFDSTAVARNRLRVDARKWVAAKLKPKVYGDKVQLADADGNKLPDPPQFIVAPVAALPKADE